MKWFGSLSILAILNVAPTAWANRVLSVTSNGEQVTLTNEATSKRWQLNESLCLFKADTELACGFVGRLTETNLVVKIESRDYKIYPGNDVQLRRETRHPSSAATSEMAVAKNNPRFDVSLGPVAGNNYFFPLVPTLQFAPTRTFSLGVDFRWARFINAGVTARCVGFMATLNYFHTHYAFRGLTFSLGVGMYSLNVSDATSSASTTPLAVQALVGWRGKPHWGLGVDIGLAGGLQYVAAKSTVSSFVNEFRGLLPVVALYLGYSF